MCLATVYIKNEPQPEIQPKVLPEAVLEIQPKVLPGSQHKAQPGALPGSQSDIQPEVLCSKIASATLDNNTWTFVDFLGRKTQVEGIIEAIDLSANTIFISKASAGQSLVQP